MLSNYLSSSRDDHPSTSRRSRSRSAIGSNTILDISVHARQHLALCINQLVAEVEFALRRVRLGLGLHLLNLGDRVLDLGRVDLGDVEILRWGGELERVRPGEGTGGDGALLELEFFGSLQN